jgi:hypothetical protein
VSAPRAVYRGYYQSGKRAGQVTRLHIIREDGPRGAIREGRVRGVPAGSQTLCGQGALKHRNSDPVIISPMPAEPPEGLSWCPKCVGCQAELSGLIGEFAARLAGS